MKKQETLGSVYTYRKDITGEETFKKKFLSAAPFTERPKNPYFVVLRYIFYSNVDKHFTVVQFKQQENANNTYELSLIQKESLLLKNERDLLIASTYLAVQSPVESIAQIVVDFMISQSKVKLIIERDLDLFNLMLNRLWIEFNTLFKIKGLNNGYWQNCEQEHDYDAYILVK